MIISLREIMYNGKVIRCGIVKLNMSSSLMENSPVIQTDEIRKKRSAIHHFHRLRMKKKLLLFRRRSRRGGNNNNNILPSKARSDGAIEQQLKWKPPCHTVLKCLVPSLLAVVAVKYQGNSEDPSKTRPLQTWSFLAAIFIYCLISLALKQSQKHHNKYLGMLSRVALACGVLSTLSLLSLLLPHFPGLVLLYASWALSTIIAAWPLLLCTYTWLRRGIKALLGILISLIARNLFPGWNFGQQQPPLQVTGPPV